MEPKESFCLPEKGWGGGVYILVHLFDDQGSSFV